MGAAQRAAASLYRAQQLGSLNPATTCPQSQPGLAPLFFLVDVTIELALVVADP